jgi:ArsR family transcriptional regulator, arsenate/arsenite/antimonite-responsive transcriptional repressor
VIFRGNSNYGLREPGNVSINIEMSPNHAVQLLAALAQEHRLAVFRLLVQAGPDGLPAGRIATELGLPPSSLSFHLAQLADGELVTQRREGRSLIYSARFDTMDGLVRFLTDNCCSGAACLPALATFNCKA